MSEMILTFLLPLDVWPRSFLATNLLESWSATDPLGEVAASGEPVIVAALLTSGIVVLAFLAVTSCDSNIIRLLSSLISVVTSFVIAKAALLSIVVSFVVAVPVSIVVEGFVVNSVIMAMAAPLSIVVSFVVAALVSIDVSFVVTSVVVAMAVPVSIVVSFVFVLAVFALLV